VITDGDAAMLKAVREVFIGVRHRVCFWHIEKNMRKHLSVNATTLSYLIQSNIRDYNSENGDLGIEEG
jgi:hypothetical protein